MRFLLAVLLFVVFVGFLTFGLLNASNTTNITLLGSDFFDVPIWQVVFAALCAGVALTAMYAIAEGTTIRLENRRLRNEVRKLETEVNYLRTQPRGRSSDAGRPATVSQSPVEASAESPAKRPPSAPVYDPETDDPDQDDDIYGGGRAV